MRRLLMGLFCGAALAAPANAAWNQASSKHFIIYADDKPQRLAEFATHLERFDRAARALLRMDDPVVGDGNRVTIYVSRR